jgi:Zn-dependent protease with chaperone function
MSLTTRAAVAILLMIGFYIFALGIAAGLFWIAYADFTYRERLDRIEIACVIAAIVILWSILPRPDRFEAPGPRINASQQPRLFAEISNIASAVGQEMPHDVYLVPEVNAWVAQRGGVAGLGSRRVMALGVPLMALLSVSQLRAVLAHEFGHYHAGDTKLSPWVYKTRMAILRTVKNLAGSRSYAAFLSYLFKWYAEMFLRITLAISRAQEYAADQLAARFAGSQALIDGLKQLHRGAAAWMSYLGAEVGPVLSAGYMPPLSSGLAQFIAAPNVRGQIEASLQKELAEGKADPFDSHPSLPERIAALSRVPAEVASDSRPATELLDNFQLADTNLLSIGGDAGRPLQPVAWDRTLDQVWAPSWQNEVEGQKDALRGLTVRDLWQQLPSGELARRIKNPPGRWPTNAERADLARVLAGAALALALRNAGWTFHTLPGEAYCEKNERSLEPFELIGQLATGSMTRERWEGICDTNGVGSLPLLAEKAVGA